MPQFAVLACFVDALSSPSGLRQVTGGKRPPALFVAMGRKLPKTYTCYTASISIRYRMGQFADQLRQVIRECGTSQYGLANQVGIAESVLSRFLSGKRGLSLETLDRLAGVLGIDISKRISTVKPRRPRGRRKKEKGNRTMTSATVWQEVADELAERAGDELFHSHRGVYFVEDRDVLCLYNNHPYKNPDLRPREVRKLRQGLKRLGIPVLAYGESPKTGEDAGYTYAMILDAGDDRVDEVSDMYHIVVLDIMSKP